MEEIYQVKISSFDFISGDRTDGLYEINWSDFLPKNADKYLINTYFYSLGRPDVYTENLQVHSDLMLNGFSYDTTKKSRSTLLTVIEPLLPTGSTADGWFIGRCSDREWTMINYPQQNQIKIQIYDVDDSILDTDQIDDWTLIIYIKPLRK
jgi:hypothetical protein